MNSRIFELEPDQLQSALLQEGFGREGEAYVRALIAYWEQDLLELERVHRSVLAWGDEALGTLVRRRADLLLLRSGREVDPWTSIASRNGDDGWISAEAAFLDALRFEHESKFGDAQKKYERSSELFLALGAEKKSLKAAYNAFILSHRLEPRPEFFQMLRTFFSRAQRLGADEVAAASAQALSQDFAIIGAGRLAKTYAEEALSRVKVGTKNYWVALLNYVWVLLMRGDRTEALFELEKCSWIEGEGLRLVKEDLEELASGKCEMRERELAEPFRTRVALLREDRPARLPTDQEDLIELVSSRDMTRVEVLAELYQADPSDTFAIDRFHHLVQRIRSGGRIGILQDGLCYRIRRMGFGEPTSS